MTSICFALAGFALADGLLLTSLRVTPVEVIGPAVASRVVVMKLDIDKTKEGDYPHPHDEDYKFGDITKRVIRDMTGNRDYEFGDGAKALSSTSMEAAEAAAAAVIDAGGSAVEAGAAAQQALDDSGYQFGDITKGAVKGFEEKVREATGNEEYKFGDITKSLAKGLFGALEKGAAAAKDKLDEDPDLKK